MIMNYKKYTLKTTLVSFLMLFAVDLVFFTGSSSKADAKKPEIAVDDKEVQFVKPTADYISRGNAYYMKGEIDKAISDYNRAIELNPGYPNACISRGCYYHYTKKQYVRAIADYSEALKLNPEDAVARRLRRDAYVTI